MGEVSGRWFIDQGKPDAGDLVDTLAVTGRFDLTDAHWATLEPLLPTPKRSGRLVVEQTPVDRRDSVA